MNSLSLDILVITDLHYVSATTPPAPEDGRQTFLGPLLLRKALLRLTHQGIAPGLIVLLGDLIDNGDGSAARQDLTAISKEAQRVGLPVLATAGNHDGNFDTYASLLHCRAGFHELAGYGFLVFHDRYAPPHDAMTRADADLALPARAAAKHPALPLIALQHSPLHPDIVADYPYMPTNREAIMAGYRRSGVFLSLGGHYHAGQPSHVVNGTTYYTAPAACEAPFRFAVVSLHGREVTVREFALQAPLPSLVDCHCHTEFAYCGTTVAVEDNIRVSRTLGLERTCITEHAFQLYFNEKDAWSWRWQTDDKLVRRCWLSGRGRMPQFRRFVRHLRSDTVAFGLEVDLRADGSLMLADEDRAGWDFLIGAVHALPGFEQGRTSQAEAEALFLRDTERLLAHPIAILAHPFRFFNRGGLKTPCHLYGRVATMLKQAGVAAELNFHTQQPDPVFVEQCLSRGVKIALATDAHEMAEVGELWPHLDVLRQVGAREADLPGILFSPFAAKKA